MNDSRQASTDEKITRRFPGAVTVFGIWRICGNVTIPATLCRKGNAMTLQGTWMLPIFLLLLAVSPALARSWTDDTESQEVSGAVSETPTDAAPPGAEASPGQKEALAAATKALRDPDEHVREEAAQSLGRMGSAAVPVLMIVLHDRHRQVRWAAIDALENIGPEAKEAVPVLIEAILDRGAGNITSSDESRAAKALGNIGPAAKEAAPALIKALMDEPTATGRPSQRYDRIRTIAFKALVQIGPEAVPAMAKALQNDEFTFRRMQVASVLGNIGREAVPALTAAIRDKDRSVRWSAIDALGNLGPPSKEAVPALIEALQDADVVLRWKAAEALGSIGPEAKGAVPTLTKALQDESCIVRMQVALALGRMGPKAKQAVPALTKVLQDQETVVRRFAAEALKQIEGKLSKSDGDDLESSGNSHEPDMDSKDAAANEAVLTHIKELQHESVSVRRDAVIALGTIVRKDKGLIVKKAMPALTEALQDEDMHLRDRVLMVLVSLGPEAMPALIEALHNESARVRISAVVALDRMGPSAKEAIPALTKLLLDPDGPQSPETLGKMGPEAKEAIPALRKLLRQEDRPRAVSETLINRALWSIDVYEPKP